MINYFTEPAFFIILSFPPATSFIVGDHGFDIGISATNGISIHYYYTRDSDSVIHVHRLASMWQAPATYVMTHTMVSHNTSLYIDYQPSSQSYNIEQDPTFVYRNSLIDLDDIELLPEVTEDIFDFCPGSNDDTASLRAEVYLPGFIIATITIPIS